MMQKERELQALLRKKMNAKGPNSCLAVMSNGERCTKKAISSHTIQRNGSLSKISEDGHVYSAQSELTDSVSGAPNINFKKVGAKKASVFPGFCSEHDTERFAPIETEGREITKSELLLLGYRTVCMELFKKRRALSVYSDADVKKRIAKLGLTQSRKAFLRGTELAITDLENQKSSYETALVSKDPDFVASIFHLEGIPPFTFAGAFAPEFCFGGNLLLPPEDQPWSSVCAFCGVVNGKPILSFQGMNIVHGHDLGTFFSSQEAISKTRVGGIALHIAIEYCENAFYRPSWVETLLPEVRQDLLHRFQTGTPGDRNERKKNIATSYDLIKIEAADRPIFV